MSEAPTASERNRLTAQQRFKLTKWVEGKLPEFAANAVTSSMAAEQASAVLGFPVTPRNMLTIAGKAADAILEHQWPSTSPSEFPAEGGSNHTNRRLAVVATVLDKVIQRIEAHNDLLVIDGDLRLLFRELLASFEVPVAKVEPPPANPTPVDPTPELPFVGQQ